MNLLKSKKYNEACELLFTHVQRNYEDAESFKAEQAPSYQDAWLYYKCQLPKSLVPNGSTYVEPVLREAVDRILPQQLNIFTATDDQAVEYRPKGLVVSKTGQILHPTLVSKAINSKLNEVFLRENNGYEELQEAFIEALVTGGAFAKWFVEEDVIEDSVEFDDYVIGTILEPLLVEYPDTDLTTLEIKIEKVETQDQQTGEVTEVDVPFIKGKLDLVRVERKIKVKAVPFHEVLVDAHATSIKDARYLCHRQVLTVGELLEMGFNEEAVRGADLVDDSVSYLSKKKLMVDGVFIAEEDTASTSDENEKRVHLYEHFVYSSLLDKKGKTKLYRVLATDKDLLEVYEVNSIPFTFGKTHTIPGSFFGDSLFNICKPFQDEISNNKRITTDHAARSTYNRVYAVKGQFDRRSLMDLRLGGIVEVNSMGAIQPELLAPLAQSHSESLVTLLNSSDKAIGTQVGNNFGAGNVANMAATTVSLLMGNEEIKDKRIAGTLARTLIKPIFEGLYNILREEAVDLTLEDGSIFNTSDLPKASNFVIDVTTSTDNSKKAGLLMNAMMLDAQLAAAPGRTMDTRLILSDILREAGISPEEVSRYVPAPQPPTPEEQQEMALQKQLAMQTSIESLENIKADKYMKAASTAKLEVETSELIKKGEADRKRDEEKSVLGFKEYELEAARINAEITLEADQQRNVSIARK